jgi:hypothetical protein
MHSFTRARVKQVGHNRDMRNTLNARQRRQEELWEELSYCYNPPLRRTLRQRGGPEPEPCSTGP